MPASTLSTFVRKVSDTVAAGEKLVIGTPPKRANSPVRCRSKSPMGRTPLLLSGAGVLMSGPSRGNSAGSNRGRPKARDFDYNPPENKYVFCSNMYTREFVMDALQSVENNVCSIELEDLIQRNDAEITTAAMDLLIDQALTDTTKKSLRQSRNMNDSKRIWTQIVFVDCISDANSYREYLNLKSVFTTNLRRRLAQKGLKQDALPIRFEAKVELHTMLDVMGVIHLLQVVERDGSVRQVRFNGYRGKEKEIPGIFASTADPQTMEWTKSTEIHILYRSRDKDFGRKANPATDLVRKCIQALETVVFDVSMDDFDTASCEMKRKSRRGALQKDGSESGNTVSLSGSSSSLNGFS